MPDRRSRRPQPLRGGRTASRGTSSRTDTRVESRVESRGETQGESGTDRQSWLYGWHAVTAALANPERRARRLLATAEAADALAAAGLLAGPVGATRSERAAIEAVLPAGAVHQGLALLADPLEEPSLHEVLMRLEGVGTATLLVLDQVTDPHNVGAVLRSADAFDARAVVLPRRHAPMLTGALAKSASGAAERVPLVRVGNLVQALGEMKAAGFWCLGLDAAGTEALPEASLPPRLALVLGAEGGGLRRLTRERCDGLLRIPMPGAMPSINVSNAAAIALYERARQMAAPARPRQDMATPG